jgi:hypothetical protein
MDDLRWRPTSKLAYATRKARGSAGQKLLLRKVRFWRRTFTEKLLVGGTRSLTCATEDSNTSPRLANVPHSIGVSA